MSNSSLMHGTAYAGQDVAGWFCSEKLDGCRGLWDGRQFWTRSGIPIDAPARIIDAMPPMPLDGEFYAGQDGFYETMRAVQHGQFAPSVKFIAFDAPTAAGDWSKRIGAARAVYPRCVASSTIAHQCDLLKRLRTVQDAGGEGLILHKPGACYRAGRVKTLLKVKRL